MQLEGMGNATLREDSLQVLLQYFISRLESASTFIRKSPYCNIDRNFCLQLDNNIRLEAYLEGNSVQLF